MNFQMFKLVLEKAEESEIKLPTSAGSWKKQESSRKTSISALLTAPKPLTVWITTNCEKFSKRWEYQNTLPPPEKPICRSRNNGYNRTWNNRMVQNCKNSTSRLYIVTCLFNFCEEYIVQNAGLDESQSAIKSARRNINDLGYADDTTLMAKSKEELKSLLMKGE